MLSEYDVNRIATALGNEPANSPKEFTVTKTWDVLPNQVKQADKEAFANDVRALGLTVVNVGEPSRTGPMESGVTITYRCTNETALNDKLKQKIQPIRAEKEARINKSMQVLTQKIKSALSQNPDATSLKVSPDSSTENEIHEEALRRIFSGSSATFSVSTGGPQWDRSTTATINNINRSQFVDSREIDKVTSQAYAFIVNAIKEQIQRYPDGDSDRWKINYDHNKQAFFQKALEDKFPRNSFGLVNAYVQYQSVNYVWVLKSNFPDLADQERKNRSVLDEQARQAAVQVVNDSVERLVFELDAILFKKPSEKEWVIDLPPNQIEKQQQAIIDGLKEKFPGLIVDHSIERRSGGFCVSRYTAKINPAVTNDARLNRLLRKDTQAAVSTMAPTTPVYQQQAATSSKQSTEKSLLDYLIVMRAHIVLGNQREYVNTVAELLSSPHAISEELMNVLTTGIQVVPPSKEEPNTLATNKNNIIAINEVIKPLEAAKKSAQNK